MCYEDACKGISCPLSLSQIKSERTDSVIRRELVSGECARQPEQPAVPAHPYSEIDVYAICDFCESKAAGPKEVKRDARSRRLPHHDLMAYDCPIAGHHGNGW